MSIPPLPIGLRPDNSQPNRFVIDPSNHHLRVLRSRHDHFRRYMPIWTRRVLPTGTFLPILLPILQLNRPYLLHFLSMLPLDLLPRWRLDDYMLALVVGGGLSVDYENFVLALLVAQFYQFLLLGYHSVVGFCKDFGQVPTVLDETVDSDADSTEYQEKEQS